MSSGSLFFLGEPGTVAIHATHAIHAIDAIHAIHGSLFQGKQRVR
jgi:hypothetical protein